MERHKSPDGTSLKSALHARGWYRITLTGPPCAKSITELRNNIARADIIQRVSNDVRCAVNMAPPRWHLMAEASQHDVGVYTSHDTSYTPKMDAEKSDVSGNVHDDNADDKRQNRKRVASHDDEIHAKFAKLVHRERERKNISTERSYRNIDVPPSMDAVITQMLDCILLLGFYAWKRPHISGTRSRALLSETLSSLPLIANPADIDLWKHPETQEYIATLNCDANTFLSGSASTAPIDGEKDLPLNKTLRRYVWNVAMFSPPIEEKGVYPKRNVPRDGHQDVFAYKASHSEQKMITAMINSPIALSARLVIQYTMLQTIYVTKEQKNAHHNYMTNVSSELKSIKPGDMNPSFIQSINHANSISDYMIGSADVEGSRYMEVRRHVQQERALDTMTQRQYVSRNSGKVEMQLGAKKVLLDDQDISHVHGEYLLTDGLELSKQGEARHLPTQADLIQFLSECRGEITKIMLSTPLIEGRTLGSERIAGSNRLAESGVQLNNVNIQKLRKLLDIALKLGSMTPIPGIGRLYLKFTYRFETYDLEKLAPVMKPEARRDLIAHMYDCDPEIFSLDAMKTEQMQMLGTLTLPSLSGAPSEQLPSPADLRKRVTGLSESRKKKSEADRITTATTRARQEMSDM